MSDPRTAVFDLVCDHLETLTGISRLQARGTIRLTLKTLGLPETVWRQQMLVVIRRALPEQLAKRGIPSAAAVCAELSSHLEKADLTEPTTHEETPEDVFARMVRGGDPNARKPRP